MCFNGTAFVSTLRPPKDEKEKVLMLKKPAANVRANFSKQWAPLIAALDAFFTNGSK